MSSSRENPSCTPFTAFATSARVSPCRARSWRVSPSRLKVTAPPATAASIPAGSGWVRAIFPFSTTTARPSTLTLTPAGIAIGIRPIRDIDRSSPDVAQDLAAHVGLAGLAAAHQSPRRGQDAEPQPPHHQRDLLVSGVDPLAGPADHLQPREERLPLLVVAQGDPDGLEAALLHLRHVADVPLALQDLGDRDLQPGARDLHPRVTGAHRVADTGQHVSDRIVHGPPVPSPARLRDARDEPLQRQVPETDAAHLEAPQESARAAAAPAPVAVPDGVPLFLPHRRDPGLRRHRWSLARLVAAERHP